MTPAQLQDMRLRQLYAQQQAVGLASANQLSSLYNAVSPSLLGQAFGQQVAPPERSSLCTYEPDQDYYDAMTELNEEFPGYRPETKVVS